MALITDLKQRGMLEDTLIVWAGEFGRTPMSQGGNGRDHHMLASPSGWPAAASKAASSGAPPTNSATSRQRSVHVHDLHATMLQLLGIEHTRLTYRFQGRDYRLTDVFGTVVDAILA